MKKYFFALMLFIVFTANAAQGADNNDPATELMNVLGFNSMMESVRQECIKMAKDQMDNMMVQIKQANPNIPEDVMQEINAAAREFSARVTNSWDASEAAKIYSNALVEGLSENDIRSAISHYRTPDGQKELKVINAAAQKMQKYVMSSIQKETEISTKVFLSQLRSISERMKNRKAQPASDK